MSATATPPVARPARIRWLAPDMAVGFIAAAVAILLIAGFTFNAQQQRADSSQRVLQSYQSLQLADGLLSLLQDAETGQRGYLLTHDPNYLAPYEQARVKLPVVLDQVGRTLAGEPEQQQRLRYLRMLTAEKMAELAQTITAERTGHHDAALAIVQSGNGHVAMDGIRAAIDELRSAERTQLAARQTLWDRAAQLSYDVTWAGSLLLLALLVVAAVLTSRSYRARMLAAWIDEGRMELSERTAGDPTLSALGQHILAFIAEYLDAPVAAMFVAGDSSLFHPVATHALAAGATQSFRIGEGLLGQAAASGRLLRVDDVPEGYFEVRSGTGQARARTLLLAPAMVDGQVHAIVELGFFRRIGPADEQFLQAASEILGVAARAARDRNRLEELLEETQRQAEELQAQQEELRVSNEELEEQGHILKESQARLETQQAELEQTNAQLAEQAQVLADQRDGLVAGQSALTEKAVELDRANRYKSEFLANMSHELRTPLNSTLILAKLLADNKAGNLTAEQVRFAQTITSAGNDLLTLINDILDLAKIESGKVAIAIAPQPVERVLETMRNTFEPMAREQELRFAIERGADIPDEIETDVQRLEQILRNLLSNALKFTHQGEIVLRVEAAAGDAIAFSVRDTGIGIAAEQQQVVFEAFRQADGSTHRGYGGTGLGLSISRDLARRLGGTIRLRSEPAKGSTFTLTLPRVARPDAADAAPAPGQAAMALPVAPAVLSDAASAGNRIRASTARGKPADDRESLREDARTILVIEDDVAFAAIQRDLAHEMGFQCVIAMTAKEGLDAAVACRPSAILLDMNLPDHSGLGVLDQLKRDPRTRHVPVHVVSVADYTQQALELGAVGYALKPVKREQLAAALQRLEQKFSQKVHRVLVVEDDPRQRESIAALLGGDDVQITAAADAAQALEHLAATTFDCMVLDLSLPDMSGYQLLEKMAGQDQIAFPPVIVYTGRMLDPEEEQALHRHSRSIIIKDARSPERLLDEVTLFLHQVESSLPAESQRMLQAVRHREAALEGRRVLVVEDDVRNVFALSRVLEPKGIVIEIARNGREALAALERAAADPAKGIDLVLMDIMMPEMDGLTAMREIRRNERWKRLPIIALTAKAMKDDQEKCLAMGANDYIAKPLDVERLLSLVRVWMPKKQAR